jgi:hypothetical protein
MPKKSIINSLIFFLLISTTAYCQEKPDNHIIRYITGTVINTDSVGNIISIKTEDQKEMAFSVPEKALITQETHNIGLMDIGESSAVSIQYYVSPLAKNVIISLVDNESVVNE